MPSTLPNFRADHVGSLLRPAYLLQARREAKSGTIASDRLREIEDRAVKEIIALQESIGLQAITDGEARRIAGIWTSSTARRRGEESIRAESPIPQCEW